MCTKTITITREYKDSLAYKSKYTMDVPCGKCPECIKTKINNWLFRMDKELERSSNPLFVTLTYDEKNLIQTHEECKGTLCRRDMQLFLKKLRHEQIKKSTQKLTYYLCGEYGSRKRRPHYHICLFNLHPDVNISTIWGRGFTLSLPLRDGGTRYVMKYMSKPQTKKHKDDYREKEFALMSKA